MKVYLHYGDASHRPMQTVTFEGDERELNALIEEAARDNWPLRVQVAQEE